MALATAQRVTREGRGGHVGTDRNTGREISENGSVLSRAPCTRLHHEFHSSRLLPKVTLLPSSQHIRAHGHFLILKPARLERTPSHPSRPQDRRTVRARRGRRSAAMGQPAAQAVSSPLLPVPHRSPGRGRPALQLLWSRHQQLCSFLRVPTCRAVSLRPAFAEARPRCGVSERYSRPVRRSGRLGVQSRHPQRFPGLQSEVSVQPGATGRAGVLLDVVLPLRPGPGADSGPPGGWSADQGGDGCEQRSPRDVEAGGPAGVPRGDPQERFAAGDTGPCGCGHCPTRSCSSRVSGFFPGTTGRTEAPACSQFFMPKPPPPTNHQSNRLKRGLFEKKKKNTVIAALA